MAATGTAVPGREVVGAAAARRIFPGADDTGAVAVAAAGLKSAQWEETAADARLRRWGGIAKRPGDAGAAARGRLRAEGSSRRDPGMSSFGRS